MSRQDGYYASPDGRIVGVQSTMGVLFSDDFGGTAIDTTKWQVFDGGYTPIAGGSATPIGSSAVVVSSSQIVITMPATSTAEYWMLANPIFAGSEDIFVTLSRSVSSVNNSCFVGLVEVDPGTGIPLLNPNLANDFTNRGGFEFGKTAGASTYGVEAVADSSGAIASGSAGTSAATMATLQEFMAEIEAVDIIGSSQLIDTVLSRVTTPARVASQCPNDGRAYKLLIRVKNTGATSCIWTLGRILVKDGQEFRVEMSGGRGDTIGQKAVAVNVANAATNPIIIDGSANDNTAGGHMVLVGGIMTSAAGGQAAGATGNQGRLSLDLSRRALIQPLGNSASHVFGNIAVASTAEATLLAAGGAGLRCIMQSVTIANLDTIAHVFRIKDTNAGTVRLTVNVPAGDTRHFEFPAGMPASAANATWTFTMAVATTTTAPEISASGFYTTA